MATKRSLVTTLQQDEAARAAFLARVAVEWAGTPGQLIFRVMVDGRRIGHIQRGQNRPGQMLPWKIYLGKEYQTEIYGRKNEALADLLAIYLSQEAK